MGIDHRRSHVALAQEHLYGPDIVVRLQEMGCKAIAESMRRNSLQNEIETRDHLSRNIDQVILSSLLYCIREVMLSS